MRTIRLALPAALLIAVSVAPITYAATPAQFAKRADAICRPAEKKIKALDKPTEPAQITSYLQQSLAIVQPAATRLQALTLPTQKRAYARRGVSYFAKQVTVLEQTTQKLQAGADVQATFDAADKQLTRYGKISDRGFRAVGATDCVG